MAIDPTGVSSFLSEFEHLRAARAEAERNNVQNEVSPAAEAAPEQPVAPTEDPAPEE